MGWFSVLDKSRKRAATEAGVAAAVVSATGSMLTKMGVCVLLM